jgi:uncharacterized protein (DUF1015 family)
VPELTPFPALRFTDSAGDISFLLAPPYDVIDEDEAETLRQRSEHNCVRLILPEGSPGKRYEAAAHTLRAWISEGILAVDPNPSAYVYRQVFTSDGQELDRLALFASLRLSPFEDGEVLPHERTHAGPKKDRLALTLATRTQLSPIFMIARDRDAQLLLLERDVVAGPPDVRAVTPDGARHELWVVEGARARKLCAAAGSHPLLIADGHHRYETALAVAEVLGDDVKAAYLLTCVVSQQDPGLIVQPTHRVLSRQPEAAGEGFVWVARLAEIFDLEDLGHVDPLEAQARAASTDGGSFVLLPGDANQAWLATPRQATLETAGIQPERGKIASVVFDELVLGALYGLSADEASHAGVLSYARDPAAAAARAATGCAFILPPVSLEDVWDTAARGGRLPPKSTYFEPKMPSGLLFRPV